MDRAWIERVLKIVAIVSILINRKKRKQGIVKRKRKQRKYWTRKWLLRRPNFGFFATLQQELAIEDRAGFKNFLRVDCILFEELLCRVGPRIQKEVTFMRNPIQPDIRLAITLRYLATGNSYKTLQYEFRVASNTISGIVFETCNAIVEEFAYEYLKCPSSEKEWEAVADGFSKRWNFHNCLGALDGKHVAIRAPPGAGSVYYNYKGFHSIVLMALVDSEYRFLYAEVGANGGVSDGGIFSNTPLWNALTNNTICVPPPTPFPGDDQPIPFSIVADDAFALRSWLMKPYAQRGLTKDQRLYNYRLSRARRVVENAFGILAHRFRCLLSPMAQRTECVEAIVSAACVLHNILRARYPNATLNLADREDQKSHDVIDGAWRDDGCLASLNVPFGNNNTREAKAIRDYQCMYYTSPVGSVPWQDSKI